MRRASSFGSYFGPRMGVACLVPLSRSALGMAPPDQSSDCVVVTTVRDPHRIISTILEPYQTNGYRIYNVPTGETINTGLPTEFKVADVWACRAGKIPPGYTPSGKNPEPPEPIIPTKTPLVEQPSTVAAPGATTDLAVAGGVLAAIAALFVIG